MTIDLSPDLETLIEPKMAAGRYGSASDLVRDALQLIEEFDRAPGMEVQEVHRRVLESGIKQAHSGKTVDGGSCMQSLIEDMDARAGSSLV